MSTNSSSKKEGSISRITSRHDRRQHGTAGFITTWLRNLRCHPGAQSHRHVVGQLSLRSRACRRGEFPVTDTLSQAEGSSEVAGTKAKGKSSPAPWQAIRCEFHSSTGGYEANATLTVSADGRSWSGPLRDNNRTSGTYTATKQVVEARLGAIAMNPYCSSLGDLGKPNGEPSTLRKEKEGPEYAFDNWACVRGEGTLVPVATAGSPPSMNNACVFEYPAAGPSHAKPENPNNAETWGCFEGCACSRRTCRERRWWWRLTDGGLAGSALAGGGPGGAGAGAGSEWQCGVGVRDGAGAAARDDSIRAVVLVASDPVWDTDQRDPRSCGRDDRRSPWRHPDGRILRRRVRAEAGSQWAGGRGTGGW